MLDRASISDSRQYGQELTIRDVVYSSSEIKDKQTLSGACFPSRSLNCCFTSGAYEGVTRIKQLAIAFHYYQDPDSLN